METCPKAALIVGQAQPFHSAGMSLNYAMISKIAFKSLI
jgi:hypothetical protein